MGNSDMVNELFEMAGKYDGRISELLILAGSTIQEQSRRIVKLECEPNK